MYIIIMIEINIICIKISVPEYKLIITTLYQLLFLPLWSIFLE